MAKVVFEPLSGFQSEQAKDQYGELIMDKLDLQCSPMFDWRSLATKPLDLVQRSIEAAAKEIPHM